MVEAVLGDFGAVDILVNNAGMASRGQTVVDSDPAEVERVMRTLDAAMPFGRVCQPKDVANVVRFLVSGRAGYVTGEKINVHGGT